MFLISWDPKSVLMPKYIPISYTISTVAQLVQIWEVHWQSHLS